MSISTTIYTAVTSKSPGRTGNMLFEPGHTRLAGGWDIDKAQRLAAWPPWASGRLSLDGLITHRDRSGGIAHDAYEGIARRRSDRVPRCHCPLEVTRRAAGHGVSPPVEDEHRRAASSSRVGRRSCRNALVQGPFMDPWFLWPLLCLAAFLAGAVNAVAGGGALLTFPGLAPSGSAARGGQHGPAPWPSCLVARPRAVGATATNWPATSPGCDCSLGPGLVGGLLGLGAVALSARGSLRGRGSLVVAPGGVALHVPTLVNRLLEAAGTAERAPASLSSQDRRCVRWSLVFQFLVGVYGGYFGAGIGILMLSALGLMGLHDLNAMNGVKTILASAINLTSVVVFVAVDVDYASIAPSWPWRRSVR